MKKIFTLLFCMAVTAVASAQTFGYTFQGRALDEGATVTIAAEEDIFGDLSCETNLPENPTNGLMMQKFDGGTANVQAKIEITHNSLNANILQWCMGGECKPFNGATTLVKSFQLNGSVQVQFDATGIQSEGYLTATLTTSIGLESHKVNILFTNGDTSGLEKILNGTGKNLTYYNLNGVKVSKQNAHGVVIVSDGQTMRKVFIK